MPVGDALFDDLAQPAVELVAPHDDGLQVGGRQRFEVEEQRRAVQLVENRVDERDDELPQLGVRRQRRCCSISSSSSISRSSEY